MLHLWPIVFVCWGEKKDSSSLKKKTTTKEMLKDEKTQV